MSSYLLRSHFQKKKRQVIVLSSFFVKPINLNNEIFVFHKKKQKVRSTEHLRLQIFWMLKAHQTYICVFKNHGQVSTNNFVFEIESTRSYLGLWVATFYISYFQKTAKLFSLYSFFVKPINPMSKATYIYFFTYRISKKTPNDFFRLYSTYLHNFIRVSVHKTLKNHVQLSTNNFVFENESTQSYLGRWVATFCLSHCFLYLHFS